MHTSPETDSAVYGYGTNDLVVVYAGEAVGQCLLELEWPLPAQCLDLLSLFRRSSNHFGARTGRRLVDALSFFQLDGWTAVEREEVKALVHHGPPFTGSEIKQLLASCHAHVEALRRLLPLLLKDITLHHALLMGRYTMGALSAIERAGVPVDSLQVKQLVVAKDRVIRDLTIDVNQQYGVYDNGRLIEVRLASYLARQGISWPRSVGGTLDMKDDTWKAMAVAYPILSPLHECRKTIAALRCWSPSIGVDGRVRTALMPFAARTGRNLPSTSKYPYAWPRWMRALIRPPTGRALITIDYDQQEFCVAAALSKDEVMMSAYSSGDPYLQMALSARAISVGTTPHERSRIRELYKTVSIGMLYDITEHGLAFQVGGKAHARDLIASHRTLYPSYHRWHADQLDRLLLGGALTTPFGWTISRGPVADDDLNPRSVGNWPIQSAAGDILRIALISLVENGHNIVAAAHDAAIVECDLDEVEAVKACASQIMVEASEVVLGGVGCRVSATVTVGGSDPCQIDTPPMLRRIISRLN
ncbi:DNA polymerase [Brevifollis gellanilyticus]|uniref:DNA polymerase n=1 Tax=Brevifollis gellanilyticus TaxID=748831 RepID=UPI001478630A|nr:DNA polymerase [Brevifollis gellanilyticus]